MGLDGAFLDSIDELCESFFIESGQISFKEILLELLSVKIK